MEATVAKPQPRVLALAGLGGAQEPNAVVGTARSPEPTLPWVFPANPGAAWKD